MPLVSIVIPTLNEELYIGDCIQSVLSQTFPFKEMEILVVDGGSTDRTADIVKGLMGDSNNIHLLNNPCKIQSAAFNIGVKNSTAPYIIRLDAHVLYDENYIERCVHHLQTIPKIGDVGGICLTKSRRDGLIPEAIAILCQSRFGIGGASFRVGAPAGFVDTVPFGAFPRDVIDEIGGMREDLARAEDNEYVTRIKKAGYKIYLDPRIISTYYARDTFKGIIKQMYDNGLSIGQLLYVDRQAIRLRHFVPFVFLISLLFLSIGSICFPKLSNFLLLYLCAYFLCAIVASLILCIKFGWKYLIILPILFFSVHCTYGLGTLVGLIRYAKRSKKNE